MIAIRAALLVLTLILAAAGFEATEHRIIFPGEWSLLSSKLNGEPVMDVQLFRLKWFRSVRVDSAKVRISHSDFILDTTLSDGSYRLQIRTMSGRIIRRQLRVFEGTSTFLPHMNE